MYQHDGCQQSVKFCLEKDNNEDHHAVCIRKDGRVVGHLERGVLGR